jgi:hypothetical protein
MGKKNKKRLQSLVFDKNIFEDKWSVRSWVKSHGYVIDKRLKRPIVNFRCGERVEFRVRQKNPDRFNKKTFKCKSLGKGVKGVFGILKK